MTRDCSGYLKKKKKKQFLKSLMLDNDNVIKRYKKIGLKKNWSAGFARIKL